MKRNILFVLFSAAIGLAALYYGSKSWATASSGFSSTPLAKGSLPEFEVFNHFIPPNLSGEDRKIWLSMQKTKGTSDLYVLSNAWQPAQAGQPVPNTGWHYHPGHSLIIVTAGTLTDYEGDDPSCTPHVYTAGMAFVDHGGVGHPHIIRNEGSVIAQNIAVQLVPSGQARRIDVAAPGNCPF